MQIFVKLNTVGSDAGPFMVYSNLNSYQAPAYGPYTKAALLAGVTITVPNSTTSIKIRSNGKCANSIIVNLPSVPVSSTTTTTSSTTTTSTTTTTTSAPCPGPGVAVLLHAEPGNNMTIACANTSPATMTTYYVSSTCAASTGAYAYPCTIYLDCAMTIPAPVGYIYVNSNMWAHQLNSSGQVVTWSHC